MIEIAGIKFEDMPNSITSTDNGLSISNTEGEEPMFNFYTADIGKFVPLFDKYKCVALRVRPIHDGGETKLNLDLIRNPETIRRFTISAETYPVQIGFTPGKTYFPNLDSLTIAGNCPQNFPDVRDNLKLTTLTIQYDKKFNDRWNRLPTIRDLTILDLLDEDLSDLAGLSSLIRLKIVAGMMKSLKGLEKLGNLETIVIETASKLTDVSALLDAPRLKNIRFVRYKKVTDWSFLSVKKNIECIRFDIADSGAFIKKLPELKYFWAGKVTDRGNKGIHFQNDKDYVNMNVEGEIAKYEPHCPVFSAILSK